jgi:putative N6-adenine-specific DNA methylase
MFSGDDDVGFRSIIWLRSAIKVMELLSQNSRVKRKEDLHDLCYDINWMDILSRHQTIKCDTVLGSTSPDLSHTHFMSLTVKYAIIDHFRDKTGQRPSVNIDDPDMVITVYIHRDKASIYRVWSGAIVCINMDIERKFTKPLCVKPPLHHCKLFQILC